MKILFLLNIFALECINLKNKPLNILINYSALKNVLDPVCRHALYK